MDAVEQIEITSYIKRDLGILKRCIHSLEELDTLRNIMKSDGEIKDIRKKAFYNLAFESFSKEGIYLGVEPSVESIGKRMRDLYELIKKKIKEIVDWFKAKLWSRNNVKAAKSKNFWKDTTYDKLFKQVNMEIDLKQYRSKFPKGEVDEELLATPSFAAFSFSSLETYTQQGNLIGIVNSFKELLKEIWEEVEDNILIEETPKFDEFKKNIIHIVNDGANAGVNSFTLGSAYESLSFSCQTNPEDVVFSYSNVKPKLPDSGKNFVIDKTDFTFLATDMFILSALLVEITRYVKDLKLNNLTADTPDNKDIAAARMCVSLLTAFSSLQEDIVKILSRNESRVVLISSLAANI